MIKLILATFLLSTSSYANEIKILCHGNRGQANIAIYESNGEVFFNYFNGLGQKSFPLYDGVVTDFTMPVINMAKSDFSTIDQRLFLSWPRKNCKWDKTLPYLMSCDGEAKILLPENSGLRSYSFSTSTVYEEALNNTYQSFKVRIGLDSEQMHYSIGIPFDTRFCEVKYQ